MSSSPPSNERVNGDSNSGNRDHHHHKAVIISSKLEIIILLSILAGLIILAVRPFGFRTFLAGMGRGEIYPIVVIFGIVGVLLVLIQRLGFIDVERSEVRYSNQ